MSDVWQHAAAGSSGATSLDCEVVDFYADFIKRVDYIFVTDVVADSAFRVLDHPYYVSPELSHL